MIALILVMAPIKRSYACIGCYCCFVPTCVISEHAKTVGHATKEHAETMKHFGTVDPIMPVGVKAQSGTEEMGKYQKFLLLDLFLKKILPAFMMMAEQFTVLMMHQVTAIGAFIDAGLLMDTMQTLQKMQARALKDYTPSVSMCMFGTNVRSLAAAESNSRLTSAVMSSAFQSRQLGSDTHSADEGPLTDRYARLYTFALKYCEKRDMNQVEGKEDKSGLYFCSEEGRNEATVNTDVDFTRTVMMPRTMNVDFSIPSLSADGKNTHFMSLANNLYGQEVFGRMDRSTVAAQGWDEYQDARSVIAKRSVAQDTFNALVALKTRGTGEESNNPSSDGHSAKTGLYMKRILTELGIPEDHDLMNNYMAGSRKDGKDTHEMSYYAQMEILATKIYQRPEFYTNLYDSPVNVRRKSVSMKAINVMLERDIYESYLRSEALLSMVLEAKLEPVQIGINEALGGRE